MSSDKAAQEKRCRKQGFLPKGVARTCSWPAHTMECLGGGWVGQNMRLRRETVLGFCRSFESAAQLTSSGLALRSSSLFGFHSAISQIQHWKELNWNRPINSPFKTGIPKTNVLGPGTPFPPVRTVEIWAKLKFPSCEGVKHPTRN
jgi:hypothetical protein